MAKRGEVLVAILPTLQDFEIVRTRLWYRIPVEEKKRLIQDRWPPKWLAFYQTNVFKGDAYTVSYFGRVTDIREVTRLELFPDDPADERSSKRYYKIGLLSLERRPEPIRSRRMRRIVFIPTTWAKFVSATEVNDLFDESPLEDALWGQFKSLGIAAERQERVEVVDRTYFLDFAVYCDSGKLDVEADGDTWHANSEKAAVDNLRDNDLHSSGWTLLRFGSRQIREELAQYCVPKIVKTINHMGGVEDGPMGRHIPIEGPGGSYQLGLFSND